MEVYTQQTAAALPKALSIKGSVTPNMFNQILQYLSFKDEIIQGCEDGNQHSLFVRQVPTHDIQKVIFDKNYLKFIRQRQKEQAETIMSTTGYANFPTGNSPARSPSAGDAMKGPHRL